MASLAAVAGYNKVSARANANPSKDWVRDVRKYAADPAATQTLAALATLVAAKVHETNPESFGPMTVKSADAHRVVIHACEDVSKITLADAAGNPVKLESKHPRSIVAFKLILFAPKDGGWLVSESGPVQPVEPC